MVLKIESGIQGCDDVTFSGTYSVLPGLKHDLIIGLPTLLNELLELFIARIRSAKGQFPLSYIISDQVHSISTIKEGSVISKSKKSTAEPKTGASSNTSSSMLSKKRSVILPDSMNRGNDLNTKNCKGSPRTVT